MKSKFFESLIYSGLPENAGLRIKSKVAILNSISYVGVIILSIFFFIDLFHGENQTAYFVLITDLIVLTSITIVRKTKRVEIGAIITSYVAFILFSLLVYIANETRSTYFWSILFPLISVFFLGITHGTILLSIYGILIGLLVYVIPGMNNLDVISDISIRLLGSYIGVSAFTIAFEIVRVKAFDQLEKTAADLKAKRKQTRMILTNVKQGIFLLDNKLNLADERSSFFDDLFVGVRDNHSFLELIKDKISEKDFIATKDYLELFFSKTVNLTLLDSVNPIEKILMTFSGNGVDVNHVWLEFGFERVVLESGDLQLLGLFRDITDKVLLEEQLEREETESLKNMESLFQVIHISPELMDEFLKDTHDEINKINDLLRVETNNTEDILNHIFTVTHNIKGNALVLGLTNFGQKLQEFEECIKELKISSPTWREILKLTLNISELKRDIKGIEEIIDKIISFQKKTKNGDRDSRYILEESLNGFISKLAKEHNKNISLDLKRYDISLIPEKYRRLFKDSINQFIRNSVAHGIEDEDKRIQRGKSPSGNIYLSLVKKENRLNFTFRDDGCGLRINKIKESAVKNKGFNPDKVEKMTTAEAVKLIFHPGFSTADSVDSTAGQGMGMSVIKKHVDSVGGKLRIKSSEGKFCEFNISLPA